MRNYWLRIVVGAVGIFLAGMVIWTAIRAGKARVVDVVESARPIAIPLAFVPFTLDGHALGTLSRVEVLRSSPEQVSAINFTVKLADSVSDDRLATCVLVARDNLDHINPGRAFTCVANGDTVGRNLAPIGHLETQRGGTFVLLARAGTLEQLKVDLRGNVNADSVAAAAEAMADSVERMADSVAASAESLVQAADSIRAAAAERADSARRAAFAARDSIRREVREQVRRARDASRAPAAQ